MIVTVGLCVFVRVGVGCVGVFVAVGTWVLGVTVNVAVEDDVGVGAYSIRAEMTSE